MHAMGRVLLLAAVSGLCGCSSGDSASESNVVTVNYEEVGSSQERSNESCYIDSEPLTATFRNEADVVIATTALSPEKTMLQGIFCMNTGRVAVPASDFYTVSIGSRPGVTFSANELASNGFTVDLRQNLPS